MSETVKPFPVLKHTDAGMRSLDVQTLCRTCPNRTSPAIPASVLERYKYIVECMAKYGAENWRYPTLFSEATTIKETCAAFGCDLRELEKQQ